MKTILIGAALLVLAVGYCVAVPRVKDGPDYTPPTSGEIVRDIRNLLNDTNIVNVPIQAYIIPSGDPHMNEFYPEWFKRAGFVSGLTGSEATAIITETSAALWVDADNLEAENEIDKKTWALLRAGQANVPSHGQWLLTTLPPNSRVGVDPFLMQAATFYQLSDKLYEKGHKLVAIQQNLVDVVWKNRPEPRLKPLEPLDQRFSGKRAIEKLRAVREELRSLGAESQIVTYLDSIAWLLNLRGADLEWTPLFYSYMIITQKELYLYIKNEKRVTHYIENHFYLEGIDVIVKEYNNTLAGISNVVRSTTGKVLLWETSEAIMSAVPFERRLLANSPVMMMKAIKNDVEANNMREAYLKEGVALAQFFQWLEENVDTEKVTEIGAADKLQEFLSQQKHYRGLSFPTISAVGEHAAIIHYSPSIKTNKQITRDEIYLLDSGGQYLDGTIDVARTIHLGKPKPEEVEAFTRVLKGHILLTTSIFPPNAPSTFLDAMARRALWDAGMDYAHDTGHGVGACLNVHEYPPYIPTPGRDSGMMKNMFTSNEPAFYKKGSFGIRIESVIQVVQDSDKSSYFNGRGALQFEDITMAPIDTKLIDVKLLTNAEIDWLNIYHRNVREQLTPRLSGHTNVVEWLKSATEPIKIGNGDGGNKLSTAQEE